MSERGLWQGKSVATYCCSAMRDQVEHKCDQHSDLADCPDALVLRSRDGWYGLRIHDGGTSAIKVSYCPWCGARL